MNQDVKNSIKKLRSRILSHKHGILNDEAEHDSGNLSDSEFTQRLKEHDLAIATAKTQIQSLQQDTTYEHQIEIKDQLVFISYARRDGRDLALRFQQDLTNIGYTVWLDTSEIEGGTSWSNEIEDAIENCHIVVALLSHGSFISEICRAEQLRSLRKGKPVIPVLVQPDAERPLHLEHLNYRDFSDPTQYQDTFQILKQDLLSDENVPLPSVQRETIIAAPPLPPHFVSRAEDLDFLRHTVIGDNTDQQIALTALRGMGGIGKSVLATALCYDDVIQAAFPDGIIWVTIGRDPGNVTEQMKFIGTKLGDSPGYYTSERAGADRLAVLLAYKAALIILDDVWDSQHVSLFRIEAPRCRTLFTTRDGGIALSVGASEVRLGTLTQDQSLALLSEWAGRTDRTMPQIAERLGYLPLALKLAGARLREGMSGKDWLDTFRHVSQMKLGRRSRSSDENLEVCFDLSVQQLITEDQTLYHAISVFPEDVSIPQDAIVKLWCQLDKSLSKHDAVELVIDLSRLALIDRNNIDETITLHDLLHDYTRSKLGDRLAETHAELLKAYNPDNNPWWMIKHDGYLYFQLGYHLIGSGRLPEFIDLVVGSPEWMESKFVACLGDIAFVDDIDLAMRQYEDSLSAQEIEIVLQLYIARQIINMRASVYTDDDFETLVWLDRKEEALNHARLRTDTLDKYTGFRSIYRATGEQGIADHSVRDEMLRALRDIPDDLTRQSHMVECTSLLRRFDDNKHLTLFRDSLFSFLPDRANEIQRLYQISSELQNLDESRVCHFVDLIYEISLSKESAGELSILQDDEEMEQVIHPVSFLIQDLLNIHSFDIAIEIARLIPNDNLLAELVKWFISQEDYSKARVTADFIGGLPNGDLRLREKVFSELLIILLQKELFTETKTTLVKSGIDDLVIILPIAIKLAENSFFDDALDCMKQATVESGLQNPTGSHSLFRTAPSRQFGKRGFESQRHQIEYLIILFSKHGDSRKIMRLLRLFVKEGVPFDTAWNLYVLMVATLSSFGMVDDALSLVLDLDEQKIQLKLDILPVSLLLEEAKSASKLFDHESKRVADRFLRRAEQLAPDDIDVLQALIKSATTPEVYRERLFTRYPEQILEFAIEHYRQDEMRPALSLIERYIEVFPDDIPARFWLSIIDSTDGQENHYLRKLFERDITEKPQNHLGEPLKKALHTIDLETILSVVEVQVKLGTGMGYVTKSILVDFGINAYNHRNETEAQQWFIRALDISPNNAFGWHWLSVVVEDINDKIVCLNRALEIDPEQDGLRQSLNFFMADDVQLPMTYKQEYAPSGRPFSSTKIKPIRGVRANKFPPIPVKSLTTSSKSGDDT